VFVIRQATPDDQDAVIRLARMLEPDGLPDPARLIGISRDSFAERRGGDEPRTFLFVLEDTDASGVVGMSAITAGAPEGLVSFQLAKRQHYSEDLQTGQVHVTLRLTDDDRPHARLHGLVLAPPYRGHRARLGSLLGLAPLHFVGLQRASFEPTIVARLPAPRPADPRDAFWEQVGRRFVNLSYEEACAFRLRSREFITALIPAQEIYVSLLPPETRKHIGRTSDEAAAARHVLLAQGFVARDRIDPVSGGPILEAARDEIELVRGARLATVGDPAAAHRHVGIVSTGGRGRFRAIRCHFAEGNGEAEGATISIPGEAAGLLDVQLGDTIGVSPLAGA
jgi:arginine/ornithine succinyltransferase subunit-like protein